MKPLDRLGLLAVDNDHRGYRLVLFRQLHVDPRLLKIFVRENVVALLVLVGGQTDMEIYNDETREDRRLHTSCATTLSLQMFAFAIVDEGSEVFCQHDGDTQRSTDALKVLVDVSPLNRPKRDRRCSSTSKGILGSCRVRRNRPGQLCQRIVPTHIIDWGRKGYFTTIGVPDLSGLARRLEINAVSNLHFPATQRPLISGLL